MSDEINSVRHRPGGGHYNGGEVGRLGQEALPRFGFEILAADIQKRGRHLLRTAIVPVERYRMVVVIGDGKTARLESFAAVLVFQNWFHILGISYF